jgi:hypothetical protein
VIRPLTAPTAPPTAAPRAAPCPPAAAAPIAAPLPAPIRPPPIVRWTGSYGLVQADSHRSSPTATTPGVICDFVISLFPIRHRYSPEGRRIQTSGRTPTFRRVGIQRCHRCISFLVPKRVGWADKFVNRVDPTQPTTIQPPTSSRTDGFYDRGRIYAGAGQRWRLSKSSLPTSLLKPFLSTAYCLRKIWLGMICKPLSHDTGEGLSLRSAASRSKLVPWRVL